METNRPLRRVSVQQPELAEHPAPSIRDTIARYSAGVAVLAAIVLLPIQSRIWHGPDGPPASVLLSKLLAPPWNGTVAASTMAQPPLTYFYAGHYFMLVYMGLLLAVVLTRSIPQSPLKTGLLGTLTVGALADVGVYWWGEYLTKAAREFMFWKLEVPSLIGSLAFVTALAFRMRRSSGPSRLAMALPFLVVPVALLITLIFQYMPHGPMLAVASTVLLLTRRQPVKAISVDR